MRILITGGMGNIGRPTASYFVQQGHEVRIVDLRAADDTMGAQLRQCDITDYSVFRDHMRGMDAVIHLAGYGNPSLSTGENVFKVNCAGTYNVFQAAAEEGIKRVVLAGSINALGFLFGPRRGPVRYFPMDEEHPGATYDAYSFSKEIIEQIAAYFWRRAGISSVCLRFTHVITEWDRAGYLVKHDAITGGKKWFAELMTLPAAERAAEVRRTIDYYDETTALRVWEDWDLFMASQSAMTPEQRIRFALGNDRLNFWTRLDIRDAVRAMELGLTADFRGHHSAFVNDGANWWGVESETLARVFYPEAIERKRPLIGSEALVSLDRVRDLLGYQAMHPVGNLADQIEWRPPMPDQTLPYSDSFSEGRADGWFEKSGQWIVTKGEYVQPSAVGRGLAITGNHWTDYQVGTRVMITEGVGGAGVVGRYRAPDQFYFLALRVDQECLVLMRFDLQGQKRLVEARLRVKLNTWYRLRLEMDGPVLRGYVNDLLMIEVNDDALTSGAIGLMQWRCTAHYASVNAEAL